MKLKRQLHGGESGGDVLAIERGIRRWLQAGEGVSPKVDNLYSQHDRDRVMAFQLAERISPASGDVGQKTLDELWPYIDAYGRLRYRLFRLPKPKPALYALPDLGPVWAGKHALSVLDQDLTHPTGGIPLYPAFDDAFRAGLEIIAPEALMVTKQSSSRPGDAFYATGESRLRYWFGHLVSAPADGRRFRKGERLGTVLSHSIGGGPHVHVGINAEALLGRGKELEHRTDYRHGAPTVGEQLERTLT